MSLFSGGNGQTEDSQGGIQDHGAYHLYDEDQRDPDAKQGLACLVTEKIHAGVEGVQYLDYKVHAQILKETEPELFTSS